MKLTRPIIAMMMVLALVLTAATRSWTEDRRLALTSGIGAHRAGAAAAEQSLQAIPSYATALLLGGLRGPLVMILWTTSETQKIEHNLQDLDTKIEWIRILQPEFDTVHLFQIWNKAYNLSVMMSSTANKYSTILDGLDYAHKVDSAKPDDLSILMEMGSVYGDKLGTSAEMLFYRRMIRRQSQARVRITMPAGEIDRFKKFALPRDWSETDQPIATDASTGVATVVVEESIARALKNEFTGAGISYADLPAEVESLASGKRVRLDQMLDSEGMILPRFLHGEEGLERPANMSPDEPWYDGSELECLAKYQPFPYGLSPLALAYNYYRRSQLLYRIWDEHSIQTSDLVIDSRPGLTLKFWAIDEWERGRRAEIQMWGLPATYKRLELEPLTAATAADTPVVDPAARDLAIYSDGLAARLMDDAKLGILDHLNDKNGFSRDIGTYASHLDEITAAGFLLHADTDYLRATTVGGAERIKLLASARAGYAKARRAYALLIDKYFTEDELINVLYPIDPKTKKIYPRVDLGDLDPDFSTDQYVEILEKAQDKRMGHDQAFNVLVDQHHTDLAQFQSDRDEQMLPYSRAEARIKAIDLQMAPAK